MKQGHLSASSPEVDARIADWRPDLEAATAGLYPDRSSEIVETLIEKARRCAEKRSDALIDLDHRRLSRPDWYQHPARIGYMAYADRFGGDLDGVRKRLPYLGELGVDVVHLLSLLTPREGESDGGFALRDYRRPDPRLGSREALDELVADLHTNDMSLCADFVMNHTSDDHEWANAAREGSEYHRDLFITFEDRTLADRYELALPEVFPTMAPGNFTWVDGLDRWVWTTFREFQWDLNWANPDVMFEMAEVALDLANLGVDILRLDAIAFTWKRMGTNCQNLPEAHLVAQALRAVVGIGAPATILLAEAIVGPDDLVGYLGRHHLERRECELGYHNQLMVQGWSMLATRRSDLARIALSRLPDPPDTATWFTYVRCHDDIGWAIDDSDAAAVGVTGQGHRDFLARYFRGDFDGSFARGVPFSSNPEARDERTSGMASTLAGVAAGLEESDTSMIEMGVRRMLALYGLAFGYGGVPIIYMGDEVCQGDAHGYLDDPSLAGDSRWSHRPSFDEDLVAERHDASTPAGQMWSGLSGLVDARRRCLALHGSVSSHPVDVGDEAVFAWHRYHPRYGTFFGLLNVGDTPVEVVVPDWAGPDSLHDVLAPDEDDFTVLEPLQVRWLVQSEFLLPIPEPGGRSNSHVVN
ncbi:MAG: alpha-amylase [Actinomycetia bacterium]|nr:alpha-amylase [Actinomycetes bacterium]